MCKAVLDIPACGPIKSSRWTGLSDEEAMTFGRRAAQTLSEQDGFVIVTLSDETQKVIGFNTLSELVTIGTLTYGYRN